MANERKTARGVSRNGRPRDRQIDEAVLDATLAALDENGYMRLSIEDIARRAKTNKPSIYRRWPTRQHLVLDALNLRLGHLSAPDTGCTLCDLDDGINLFVNAFKRLPPDLLGPLLADCANDPELHQTFMTTLFDPPRAAVEQCLDRALARGDLRPDIDRELTLDMLGSLVHYRALFGHAPTSDEDIERSVEALLRGIATDYDALLKHSREVSGDPRVHHLHV